MRNSEKGFTLIELLVVIGIIFVLASFLAPALLRAREQASRSSCLANIRSIGQAMQIYANENDARFPVGGAASSGEGSTLGNTNESFAAIYNTKTFNETKVFVCPNKKRNNPPTYEAQRGLVTDAGQTAKIISYVIVMSNSGSTSNARKPIATDSGSNILLMEDPLADQNTSVSNIGQFNEGDNHGADGCNVYRINGSTSWFRGNKITALTTDATSLPLASSKDANICIEGDQKYEITGAHLVRQNT